MKSINYYYKIRPTTRYSELEQHLVRLAQLSARFTAWIGPLDVGALKQHTTAVTIDLDCVLELVHFLL